MAMELTRRDMMRYSLFGVGAAAMLGLAGCSTDSAGAPAVTPGGSGQATDFTFGSWSLSEEAAKPTIQSALDTFAAEIGRAHV